MNPVILHYVVSDLLHSIDDVLEGHTDKGDFGQIGIQFCCLIFPCIHLDVATVVMK